MGNRPTQKQMEILRLVVADGGLLQVGGLDGRKVSRRALNNCLDCGLLERSKRWHWTHSVYADHFAYELTDAGRAALTTQHPENGDQ